MLLWILCSLENNFLKRTSLNCWMLENSQRTPSSREDPSIYTAVRGRTAVSEIKQTLHCQLPGSGNPSRDTASPVTSLRSHLSSRQHSPEGYVLLEAFRKLIYFKQQCKMHPPWVLETLKRPFPISTWGWPHGPASGKASPAGKQAWTQVSAQPPSSSVAWRFSRPLWGSLVSPL